ncbi:MAG TPA: hypothetical protein VFT22_24330 [Kofleriaceae bacterium]|nr:hypothetical protein [Kofleriaceae bacterium]
MTRAARSKRKPKAAAAIPVAPAAMPGRTRDVRPLIYGVLDVVFAVGYAAAIWKVIPNRLPSAAVHLWTFPITAFAMGFGCLLGKRRGWWIAVIAGSAALLSTSLLIVRIAISAAFLAGVYGAFGQAAATFALVMVALVIELVALLPIVQVKYLMTRAGRRAFGVSAR